MSAIPYCKSLESSSDSWFSMPESKDGHRDLTFELRSLDRDDTGNNLKPSWRSLFAFTTQKDASNITVALLSTIASSLLKPAAAIFFGNIFSQLTKYGAGDTTVDEAVQQVSKWCAALAILGLAVWLVEGVFLSSWMGFGERQAKAVRERMFTGLLDKDMEWYDLQKDGISTLVIRIQTQIRELQLSVSQPMGFLVYEISASLGSITLALIYSWNLTLVILAVFPVAALVLFLVSRGLGPAIEAQKRELTLASKYANTAITSIDTVKAFNGQDQELWQYYVTIKKVAQGYYIQARANAMQFGIIKFLTIGIFVQGFWYGLVLVRQGLDPGSVVTTFYACLTAMQAIEIVLPQWLVLTKGMSAGETLKSILTQIQDITKVVKPPGNLQPVACNGDIEVNGVAFAYPSNSAQDVLKNATFFFPAGETTFVVGRSGSGKSTLGNLLLKYYEPSTGEILVDGQAIDKIDTEWLRQNITLVQQQSVLFNDTIFQNIAFGKHERSTNKEIWEAAKTADLESTINDLAQGLDTMVGANGKSLSGGQQQRVALARARLRDAPILILDEATSALDHTSRDKVNKLLRTWRKGKTTIIITHDISQIEDDEYVYVLDGGVVMQEGYRKKLAEKLHGTFASFLPLQADKALELQPQKSLKQLSRSIEGAFLAEEIQQRWNTTSTAFRDEKSPNMGNGRFSGLPGNRLSMGFGALKASDLRADAIWSSPVMHDEGSKFLSPYISSLPPKPYVSPRLASHPASPVSPSAFATVQQGPTSPLSVIPSDFNFLPRPRSLMMDTDVENDILNTEPEPVRLHSIPTTPTNFPNFQAQKQTSLKDIFSTIWPTLAWNEKIVLILGFIAAFVIAASTPTFAYVFARLLGVFYTSKNQASEAQKFSLILLGIAAIDGTASFCYHYALEYCGQAWVNSLRVEALRRILAQPKSWFDKDKNSVGRLNECLDRNAEEMRNLIGRFAGPVWVAAWMLGISIVWSFTISWRLTLVALACAPVMYLATRVFDRVSSRWEDKCNHASEAASTIFAETFANIRVVRALTLEKHFNNKHTEVARNTFKTGKSRAVYSGLLFGLTDSISFFISALIFYYGIILLRNNELTVDQVLQVVQLLLFGISNASAAIVFIPQINNSRTTATQMLRLARLPINSHESLGMQRLENPFPVEFMNLSFTYPSRPSTKTLSDITLTLNPGTCTALVGPSGSGKSTIASILLGLYPPDTYVPRLPPSLTFAGIANDRCSMTSLRTHISIVPQHPTLFPDTIQANILYGLPPSSPYNNATSATEAAQQAGIHDFIISSENGYRTLIGEGGQGLSGGQAQRIAIARALVRKPKILVLDEATSALDALSAEAVRETVRALLRLNQGLEDGEAMAVLVISHGVEMMKIADEVVMIDGGVIVERGGFEDLRMRGGSFAKLIGEEVVLRDDSDNEGEASTGIGLCC